MSTNYEALHYAVFSSLLFLTLSPIQVFFFFFFTYLQSMFCYADRSRDTHIHNNRKRFSVVNFWLTKHLSSKLTKDLISCFPISPFFSHFYVRKTLLRNKNFFPWSKVSYAKISHGMRLSWLKKAVIFMECSRKLEFLFFPHTFRLRTSVQ
jgi:hypothetical protein